jgi:hypothetical protein
VHERVYSDEEEEPYLEARERAYDHEHGQSDHEDQEDDEVQGGQ